MRRTSLGLLVTALVALLLVLDVTAQSQLLGDYPLRSGSDLSIVSPHITLQVVFEEDASVSRPTLTATVVGTAPVPTVTRGLIVQSGNTFTVRNWTDQAAVRPPMSGASSASPNKWAQFALPLAVVAVVMILASGSQSSSSSSSSSSSKVAMIVAALIVIVAVAVSQPTATEAHVVIRVRVPVNFEFGAVSVSAKDGQVTSTDPLAASSFAVDLCGDEVSAGAGVSVNGLALMANVQVCAVGDVVMSGLILRGPAHQMTIESQASSVSVGVSGLRGSLSLNSGTNSITATGVSDSCTFTVDTAGEKTGTCSGSSHSLHVTAATSVTFALESASSGVCPAGWTGDPPALPNVPTSPAVSTAAHEERINIGGYPWVYLSGWDWNVNMGPATSLGNNAVATGTIPAWYTNEVRLFVTRPFAVKRGTTATLSFRPQASAPAPANLRFAELSLYAFTDVPMYYDGRVNLAFWYFNLTSSDFEYTKTTYPAGSLASMPLDGSTTFEIDLPTTASDFGGHFMIVFRTTPGFGNAYTMQYHDLAVDVSVPTAPAAGDVNGDSERVIIPKMPSALDPNPRTADKCPHMWSGLKHWHDPATWPGNVVPTNVGTITIPANTDVLISSCSLLPYNYVYERIHVPATSKLIFSDADITLRIRDIFVEGELHMGGPECRLNGRINIEFVGAKSNAETIGAGLGTKGIGVTGSIDMHGYQYHPTWTRLASSIYTGSDILILQDDTNWEVGQQIVVATSAFRDLEHDANEVRTIRAIDMNGRRIQVDRAFHFYHYAGTEHQVEVGLLSRRITLSGDQQSELESFGGHTRVTGTGRFAGVATVRMGQKNMLGKYPFHFHAMGPSPTSFVKDCSVVNSYFRCIAIHATNESQALRNVVFNATGHCIYLEDGVEELNVVNYNLAVKVNMIGEAMGGGSQNGDETNEGPNLILPADSAAAGFYITNAYNTFIGNAASGGWAGFSFPNLPRPIGISRNVDMYPERRPTLVFSGNTAHSSGYKFGGAGCMYVGGRLDYPSGSNLLRYNNGRFSRDTRSAFNPNSEGIQYFNHTKTWLCGLGISHWGDRVEIVDFESHDVGRSVQVFGEAWFSRALVNVRSQSLVRYMRYGSGFQFYDTWVKSLVSDVIFRGFSPNTPPWDPTSDLAPYTYRDERVFTALVHSDRFKPQGISATKNLRFENTARTQYYLHKWIDTGSSRYLNFVDWDGSFGGTANVAQILGSGESGWWRWRSGCTAEPAWFLDRCPRGDREVVNLDLLIPGLISYDDPDWTGQPNINIGYTHLFGPGLPAGEHSALLTRDYGVTGISKQGWYFHFTNGSPRDFEIVPGLFPTGQYIVYAARYPAGTTFTVNKRMNWSGTNIAVSLAASFNAMMAVSDGSLYFFDGTYFYLKIVQPQAAAAAAGYTRDGVTIYSISNNAKFLVTASCATNPCTVTTSAIPSVSW